MDHDFEALGDERFQELCQSIIASEYPDAQAFPVGQPDGGRDAIAYRRAGNSNTFFVFQVKFVRNPVAITDPLEWLKKTIQAEAPKINKLVTRGAEKYFLFTNVRGSAHLDVGTIDKLNAAMSSMLPVPSQCLWRDDLNRSLETKYDLKWAYPELLTNFDLIRWMGESGLNEHANRRTSALKAFLASQFSYDEKVKFKQVDLQNNLLDLFVDVPIEAKRPEASEEHWVLRSLVREVGKSPRGDLGAAQFLLASQTQQLFRSLILEGAPGQGKSTVSQFVCQVYRLRLLNSSEARSFLPLKHSSKGVRLPIKVDLRDLAQWLQKRDPFSTEETNAPPPNWHRSLEAFLAHLISQNAGGAEFSVSDLQAVVRISSVFLAFDGLDEVADIILRKEVAKEITLGVKRLSAISPSIFSMVTSRPTAFADSLGFDQKEFPHFTLASLSSEVIAEYADKWMHARKLTQHDISDVKKILRSKLELPHLKELARNPMQLTILLSLIHTKGVSLPDKRTSLYNDYVNLFFDRESEKSKIVREHRDLLIELHGYVAWLLHANAEADRDTGRITAEKLRTEIEAYLKRDDQPLDTVAGLFRGCYAQSAL